MFQNNFSHIIPFRPAPSSTHPSTALLQPSLSVPGVPFIAQLPTSFSGGEREWSLERQIWPCCSLTKFLWWHPITVRRTRVQILFMPSEGSPYSFCLSSCTFSSPTQCCFYSAELLTFPWHSFFFFEKEKLILIEPFYVPGSVHAFSQYSSGSTEP